MRGFYLFTVPLLLAATNSVAQDDKQKPLQVLESDLVSAGEAKGYDNMDRWAYSEKKHAAFIYYGTMLQYGLTNRAGFTVITGEIGCGKTTLIRHLLNQIDDEINIGLITNTRPRERKLLSWILMAFDQPFERQSYVALYKRFQDYLVEEYAKRGRTILIIDEAQNLGADNLEELRMLSNINADKHQLLQLILVGQSQLKDMLQDPEMIQFCQRVSSDFHIRPLLNDETIAYIDHRMTVAGGNGSVFTDDAKSMIFQASHGVPRVINILCDTALVYAFAVESERVTAQIVQNVLADKKQYGVFQVEGTKDWPAPLKEVSS